METNRAFIRCAKWALYLTFVVVFMGAFVRATHSGMGCPDWPRCYGKWIPPMNAGQLPSNYEKYLNRQNIDSAFNAVHTWTEYVNRMTGLVLGIVIIILTVWAYGKYFPTKKRSIFYWSLGLLLLFLSEALLGWALVASNLNVWTLTAHMLPALLMGVFAVVVIFKAEAKEKVVDKRLTIFLWMALIAVFLQIFIGTQVRAEVDTADLVSKIPREQWLQHVGAFLQVHEIFAWVAVLCCIAVVGNSFVHQALQRRAVIILILVLAELLLGFLLAQMRMPQYAQPLHMLFSSILMVTVFSQLLRVKST